MVRVRLPYFGAKFCQKGAFFGSNLWDRKTRYCKTVEANLSTTNTS